MQGSGRVELSRQRGDGAADGADGKSKRVGMETIINGEAGEAAD